MRENGGGQKARLADFEKMWRTYHVFQFTQMSDKSWCTKYRLRWNQINYNNDWFCFLVFLMFNSVSFLLFALSENHIMQRIKMRVVSVNNQPIRTNRDAGEGEYDGTPERGKMTGGHRPMPFENGDNGVGGTFSVSSAISWLIKIELKQFVAAIRAPRNFRMVFYNFFYHFWGQYYCWTETNVFGNDLFILYKFPSSSTLLLPLPYPPPALPLFRRPCKQIPLEKGVGGAVSSTSPKISKSRQFNFFMRDAPTKRVPPKSAPQTVSKTNEWQSSQLMQSTV